MYTPQKIQVYKEATFTGHRDCVYALEPMPDEQRFFSAAGDGMVVRWDLQKPDQGELVAQVSSSVYAMRALSDRKELWIGQNFDGIHMIDLHSRQAIRSLGFTKEAIFDISDWESNVYIATGDGTVTRIDKNTYTVQQVVKASDKSARSLAINPQTQELAVGYSDHHIRIFDARTLQLKQVLSGHTNSVFSVVYSPDYRCLLSGGRDAKLNVWDVQAGYVLQESVIAHMYAINHIAYRADGQYFATGSMDKSVKIWDAETFRLLKVIDKARHAGHGTSVNKLLWIELSDQLISASDDRTLSVWTLENL